MGRAWVILLCSFAAFALLMSGLGVGVWAYRDSATRPRTAVVTQIANGMQVQIRDPQQSRFRIANIGDSIGEGDRLSTDADTGVEIALFDGTKLNLSGNTVVLFERLRAPRYLGNRVTVVLRQERGRAIVTIGPDAPFAPTSVDVETESGIAQVRQSATTFRVLVITDTDIPRTKMDVSVLSGTAITVVGAAQRVTLHTGEQTMVAPGTPPSSPTIKQRELLDNGAFRVGADPASQPASHWARIDDQGNRI